MNATTPSDIQNMVSAEEWQLRVDLAACYRLVALYGCSNIPRSAPQPSACAQGEATYACQVERYHNVNVD